VKQTLTSTQENIKSVQLQINGSMEWMIWSALSLDLLY